MGLSWPGPSLRPPHRRSTARVKGGGPLAGVHSVRHTLFLFPPPSTKSPIIPSLRHCHPTIASAVLQQPWGEAARHAFGYGGCPCWFCPFVLWLNGGGAGADILGGEVRFGNSGGRSPANSTTDMGGGSYSLRPRPCLAETTTVSSGHAAPFNLGSKHGGCGDGQSIL